MRGRSIGLGGCILAASFALLGGLSFAGAAQSAEMQVEPDPLLSFGSLCVGKSSVKAFTVTNIASDEEAESLNVSVNRTGSNAFVPSSGSLSGIAPGDSRGFAVTFAPVARASYSAVYSFTPSSGGTETRQVSGTGRERKLSASRTSVSFGEQRVGTRSPSQNLTLSNPGQDPVTVTSVKRVGAHGGDFRATPPAATFNISPGGAAVVSLALQPSAAGARRGALEISYSNQWCPTVKFNVGLVGTGIVPNVVIDPNPVEVGSSPKGKESKPVTVTVSNNGRAPLKITAIQVIGTDAADFSLQGLPVMPLTVPPAGIVEFQVRMTPSSEGLRSAGINVLSDDPDAPALAVPLRGSAGAASTPPSARPTTSSPASPSSPPSARSTDDPSKQAIARSSNDSLALGMVIGGVGVVFGGLLLIRRLVGARDEDY